MAKVKIQSYGLAWSDAGGGGRVTLNLEGDHQKELDIENADEFVAISLVLGRGDPHLLDDTIITSGWVST